MAPGCPFLLLALLLNTSAADLAPGLGGPAVAQDAGAGRGTGVVTARAGGGEQEAGGLASPGEAPDAAAGGPADGGPGGRARAWDRARKILEAFVLGGGLLYLLRPRSVRPPRAARRQRSGDPETLSGFTW